MTIETLKTFLLYSLIINAAVVTLWFLLFTYSHDWLYRLHCRWFQLTLNQFDALSYAGIMAYKIGLYLLNVVPLIALWLMG